MGKFSPFCLAGKRKFSPFELIVGTILGLGLVGFFFARIGGIREVKGPWSTSPKVERDDTGATDTSRDRVALIESEPPRAVREHDDSWEGGSTRKGIAARIKNRKASFGERIRQNPAISITTYGGKHLSIVWRSWATWAVLGAVVLLISRARRRRRTDRRARVAVGLVLGRRRWGYGLRSRNV